MLDNAASTRKHDPWRVWLRRASIALGVALLVLGGLYGALRMQALSRLSAELVQLQADIERLQQQQDTQLTIAASRLDDLERTLFGDVVAKLEKTAPSGPNRIELWQRNRDAELRRRIEVLERRLHRLEYLVELVK